MGFGLITVAFGFLVSMTHGNEGLANFTHPYAVQAVVDAAKIIGLPPARVVREQASKSQLPDYFSFETDQFSKPVSWRRLFFRKYFSG